MSKVTKRQFITSVQGIPGNWRAMTGGGTTGSATPDYDGGALKPDLLGGLPEYEDIELTRTYDPARDDAWLAKYRKLVSRARLTVSKQTTDMNLVKIGKPLVYPNCLLTGLTEPETDAASSDAGEITITLSHTGPA